MLQFSQLQQLIIVSFLVAAAINDLKKREVPNWVNYGLVVVGLALGLLQSAVTADWHFIIFSIAGTAAALALSSLMFYTGQWGGGDSKLLIGMGAALGLSFATAAPFLSISGQFASFLFNLVAVSLFYAIAMGSFLAFRNKDKFTAELKKQMESCAALRKFVLVAAVVGLIAIAAANDLLVRISILIILVAMFFGLYLSIMAKAVEKACMLKKVSPLKLTEGDWIARDVVVGGKRICGPKDLGIEKGQIRQLVALYWKKKIRYVTVKEGIPFAPTFLIAYLVTIFAGNIFFFFLR